MTDTSTTTDSGQANTVTRILAALKELGEATAAALAEHAGIGYSTTTPKLRALEADGHAERFRTAEGQTLWRLTATAPAGTAAETTGNDEGNELAGSADVVPEADTDALDHTEDQAGRDADDGLAAADDDTTPGQSSMDSAEPAPLETATVTEVAVDATHGPASAPQTGTTTADPAAGPEAHDGHAGEPPSDNPPPSADLLDADDADPNGAHEDGHPVAAEQPQVPADEPADTAASGEQDGRSRRSPGSMRAAILDVVEAHPDRQYKVGELCKLIDQANEGTGAAKASQGAVYNAATKLAGKGTLIQTLEKPATFQLTPRTD